MLLHRSFSNQNLPGLEQPWLHDLKHGPGIHAGLVLLFDDVIQYTTSDELASREI